MNNTPSLQMWLEVLRTAYTASGLVHVGAGDSASLCGWSGLKTICIEAHPDTYASLANRFANDNDISVIQALITDKNEDMDFNLTSNPLESTFLTPAKLRPLWKNITLRATLNLPGRSLDSILNDLDEQRQNYDWLAVDCFPALPILQGSRGFLSRCSVILVRVFLQDIGSHDHLCGSDSITTFLKEHGFLQCGLFPERHPLIGIALFTRHWSKLISTIHNETATWKQKTLEQREDMETLIAARDHAHNECKLQRLMVEALQTKISAMRNDLVEITIKNENMLSKNAELQQTIDIVRASNFELRTELDNIQAKNDDAQEKIRELQQTAKDLIDSNTSLSKDLESTKAAYADILSDITSQKEQFEALQAMHEILTKDFKETQEARDEALERAAKLRKTCQNEIEKAQIQIEAALELMGAAYES